MIHLGALSAAFAARHFAIQKIVLARSVLARSLCQFRVEFILFFAAGMAVCLYNLFVFGFPFLQSGMKVVLGFSTIGFFAALDLALARERSTARKEAGPAANVTPPDQFYPLTRRFTLVSLIVVLLVTGVVVLVVERDLAWFSQVRSQAESLHELRMVIFIELVFVMAVLLVLVINLVYSYSRNLKLLFNNQTEVLEKVAQGNLDNFVPVVTQDEFGFIAGHTNTMIEGLKDRLRLAEGIKVAQKVQQNLIPQSPPRLNGHKIAAKSLYSDETGGDYLDFFEVELEGKSGLGVVVGDVTGHGVGAALLMASVRGFLRQRAVLPGSLARMMDDVNRQLVRDTKDTGRFMSLFFLVLDSDGNGMTWVSCGHDPALIFDPAKGAVEELKGHDLVLGVEKGWSFTQYRRGPLQPGQILVLATDGVWEAAGPDGRMFGKERMKKSIMRNAEGEAGEILQNLFDELIDFRGGGSLEDDATLVVIKAET